MLLYDSSLWLHQVWCYLGLFTTRLFHSWLVSQWVVVPWSLCFSRGGQSGGFYVLSVFNSSAEKMGWKCHFGWWLSLGASTGVEFPDPVPVSSFSKTLHALLTVAAPIPPSPSTTTPGIEDESPLHVRGPCWPALWGDPSLDFGFAFLSWWMLLSMFSWAFWSCVCFLWEI